MLNGSMRLIVTWSATVSLTSVRMRGRTQVI